MFAERARHWRVGAQGSGMSNSVGLILFAISFLILFLSLGGLFIRPYRKFCYFGIVGSISAIIILPAIAERPEDTGSKTDNTSSQGAQHEPTVAQDSNVVVSRGAILCTSLADAKISYELAKMNSKQRGPDGCWYAPVGKEIMGISVLGQYAYVAPLDELNNKAWTNIQWLETK